MFTKYRFLFSIFTVLLLTGSVAFGQSASIEPFEKLKIRGAILVNYHVSNEYAIQFVDTRNENLLKTTVRNKKLTIKHLKIKPNQNKQVEINLYGPAVKQIAATQTAIIKSSSPMLTDTAKICIASVAELHTTVQSASLTIKLMSGGFGFFEGEIKYLNLKVKTGAKFRAHKATISKAVIKITTGGFAALKGETDVEGKVVTGGELKFYGKGNDTKIKRHTHGVIRQSEADEL
jgi:hypothetical protein